jgi:dipeptide/tripeptide permease
MLNSIEMFERLAYFGIRAVVPLYIMQAGRAGRPAPDRPAQGLDLHAWWAIFQSFLPIVTGGIADRYGYKRVLAVRDHDELHRLRDDGEPAQLRGFFAGILVLATGTAFFKPALQGSIAQSLTRRIRRWAGAFSTGW